MEFVKAIAAAIKRVLIRIWERITSKTVVAPKTVVGAKVQAKSPVVATSPPKKKTVSELDIVFFPEEVNALGLATDAAAVVKDEHGYLYDLLFKAHDFNLSKEEFTRTVDSLIKAADKVSRRIDGEHADRLYDMGITRSSEFFRLFRDVARTLEEVYFDTRKQLQAA